LHFSQAGTVFRLGGKGLLRNSFGGKWSFESASFHPQ
jgi:hypothetical protein